METIRGRGIKGYVPRIRLASFVDVYEEDESGGGGCRWQVEGGQVGFG